MSACKSHQRQIALLAAQALNENESAAVRDHLRECAECRRYAAELEMVVHLYAHDAERPLAPMNPARAHRFEAPAAPWLKWLFPPPRPAIICLSMLLLAAASLLLKKGPERVDAPQVVQTRTEIPSATTPTIGNLRHLAAAELDALARLEPAQRAAGTDFVYSVGTRSEAYY